MSGPLASHAVTCETVEFVIDDEGQRVARAAVSVTPGAKQSANLADRWFLSLVIAR
jgi:hypothetical protein